MGHAVDEDDKQDSRLGTYRPSSLSQGAGWKNRDRISHLSHHRYVQNKKISNLVAQMVKNLPATQETWVQSLVWEDPLEEGMATHSSILA